MLNHQERCEWTWIDCVHWCSHRRVYRYTMYQSNIGDIIFQHSCVCALFEWGQFVRMFCYFVKMYVETSLVFFFSQTNVSDTNLLGFLHSFVRIYFVPEPLAFTSGLCRTLQISVAVQSMFFPHFCRCVSIQTHRQLIILNHGHYEFVKYSFCARMSDR